MIARGKGRKDRCAWGHPRTEDSHDRHGHCRLCMRMFAYHRYWKRTRQQRGRAIKLWANRERLARRRQPDRKEIAEGKT